MQHVVCKRAFDKAVCRPVSQTPGPSLQPLWVRACCCCTCACCCCTTHVLNLLRQNFLRHGSVATCVQPAALEDNMSRVAVNAYYRRALAGSFTAVPPIPSQLK